MCTEFSSLDRAGTWCTFCFALFCRSGLPSWSSCCLFRERNRPLSRGDHVESPENKKLCFCTSKLGLKVFHCEARRAKCFVFMLSSSRVKKGPERHGSPHIGQECHASPHIKH